MKLIRPRTFVIFALAGLAGAALLHTSQSVQHAEERLDTLELSVYREEEKIRMLKAEWETLNRPERLERLAQEFLDLVPPSPDQITRDHLSLPDPQPIESEEGFGYEPLTQPVSLASPPVPRHKPSKPKQIAEPKQPEVLKQKNNLPKEKEFGDLLNELGGEGGAP